MIAPQKWLNDYLQKEIEHESFVKSMIMTGNAIENIISRKDEIKNVVVGRIEKIFPHPMAKKLQVCIMDTGQGRPVQVITGADNVFEGALVPVALEGARLPGGIMIEEGNLRGLPSYGMLCSGEELGIVEDDYPGAGVYGILILKDGCVPGMDICDAIGLNDIVYEFEVGANRPDCLSLMGLAREAAAATGNAVKYPRLDYQERGGDISDYISVEVLDKTLCTRYLARAVKNVKIAPSPKWMQERLISAGVRPISNIVDITNFVMIEMGQPMHAFDLNDIDGGRIVVRRAKEGERIVTLDDKERILTPSMLLICDAAKPIGIAGVMGGLNSEIKENTQTVIFEAAKFAYGNIRQTSRTLGLVTESSTRFAKGVDARNALDAMNRALHLVEELGAGEVVSGAIDILSEDIEPRALTSSVARINALLGTEISGEAMAGILNRLELETTLENGRLKTMVSGLRADISCEADIGEEVARIYGYDNIPVNLMKGDIIRGGVSGDEKLRDSIRTIMMRSGFFECLTYSFGPDNVADKLNVIDNDALVRNAVKIKNPLGEDRSAMRTTPVPDILNVVATNLNRKVKDIRVFELGSVYWPQSLPLSDLPEQSPYLCAAVCGKDEDFYSLKMVLENLFWILNIENVAYHEGGRPFYHPGRKAVITADGNALGSIGEIHPLVAKNFGVEGERVVVAWLQLKEVVKAVNGVRKFSSLPRYPALERDLAFVLPEQITAAEVEASIRAHGGSYLKDVQVFDVYTGERIGEGKKSIAFSLAFRAADRTLSDADIAGDIENIVEGAGRDVSAYLRQ